MRKILFGFLCLCSVFLVACSNSDDNGGKKASAETEGEVPVIKGAIGNVTYDIPEIMEFPADLKAELNMKDPPEEQKIYLFKFPFEVTGSTTNTKDDAFNLYLQNDEGIEFAYSTHFVLDTDYEEYFGETLYSTTMGASPGTKSYRYEVFIIADKFVEAGGEWSLVFKRPIGTVKGIQPLGELF